MNGMRPTCYVRGMDDAGLRATMDEVNAMMRDSYSVALEWDRLNAGLALRLNDALDALPTRDERIRLFAGWPRTFRLGTLPERMRRREDRLVPVGTLVVPREKFYSIYKRPHRGCYSWSAVSDSPAVVVGQPEHGSARRLLHLCRPWADREGTIVLIAEASSHELRSVHA